MTGIYIYIYILIEPFMSIFVFFCGIFIWRSGKLVRQLITTLTLRAYYFWFVVYPKLFHIMNMQDWQGKPQTSSSSLMAVPLRPLPLDLNGIKNWFFSLYISRKLIFTIFRLKKNIILGKYFKPASLPTEKII